jgi:nucleoside recognition membrane protein YjiH
MKEQDVVKTKDNGEAKKKHVGIGAWISLAVFIVILSGVFMNSDSALKVLDFTNLNGAFGTIGDTKMNLIGANGTGAKDGFMAGLNLLPGIMLFCGLMAVFKAFGAFDAAEILFKPILRPLLGIPGKAGIAFVSSFTGSDVAAVLTRELYDEGELTDDERTVFVAYQYAASACINNTITGGAPLVSICPLGLGPILLVEIFCKLVGANVVRLIIWFKGKKKTPAVTGETVEKEA